MAIHPCVINSLKLKEVSSGVLYLDGVAQKASHINGTLNFFTCNHDRVRF